MNAKTQSYIDEVILESERACGELTEGSFDYEADGFVSSLMTELEAFANRSMLQHTDELKKAFDAPLTLDFEQGSEKLIARFQLMTHLQRGELYGKIEHSVKSEVKAKYRGRDMNDVNELASKLSTSVILGLKSKIEGGDKNLEQHEV